METKLFKNLDELREFSALSCEPIQAAEMWEYVADQLSKITRRISKGPLTREHRIRAFFILLLISNEITIEDMSSRQPEVHSKKITRDLAFFHESGIFLRYVKKRKGIWSHPGSRAELVGRPPYTYRLNPQIFEDSPVWPLEGQKPEFSLSAWKLIATTPQFRDAVTRTAAAMLKIIQELPPFMKAVRGIPEVNELFKKLKVEDNPQWLKKVACIVPGEMADAIIASMLVSTPDEDLPTAVNYRRKSMRFL